MAKQTTIADVKRNCPVFKTGHCPYTGLKKQLAKSTAFQHGCIVKPGQCKYVSEVSDVLASVVPKDEAGEKIMAHGIQQAVLLGYKEEKKMGKSCPVLQNFPFNTKTDGTPVFSPQSAINSVYVTMDSVKKRCPAFKKGTTCPYNLPEMKGLGKGCPEFKNGCPFKNVKTVGEFREKLGEMRDKCKGKANNHKAIKLITTASSEKVAELGHCPFHKYGCQVKEDLDGQPITNDFVQLGYAKKYCPVFENGHFCPYDIPCLKGLGTGCPEFKDGCPFKRVKTIGEFREKLGEMRDECKGKENYEKALDMIMAATGEQVGKFGHCPFFNFGCMLKTDENDKPIHSEWFTMDYVKEHCPAFQNGKFCPYNVPELKGLAKGCPAFKNGCPFKNVRTVGEFEGKLAEMRDECTGKTKYGEALKIIHGVNGKESAKIGHCPFFKFGCPLKTDRQGKPIVGDLVRLDFVKEHCPSFHKGKSCPYDTKEIKELASGCPEFKHGCPFKNLKDTGEVKAKLGEMRDASKAKEKHTKAMELVHEANAKQVVKLGHCPFFASGCPLKKDQNGKFIVEDLVRLDYVKEHCPSFHKGTCCPYNTKEIKELASGCPEFKHGCPFKNLKDIEEVKAKLGEMRDTSKAKEKHVKAMELVHEVNGEMVFNYGHCPFFASGCPLKRDQNGKFITPETMSMDYVRFHCAAFEKGKACPYNVPELKGLGRGCPTFAGGNCPFKDVKNVGELKAKMGEMRDTCKGKRNYKKAIEIIEKASKEEAKKIGHCPFNHDHCELKTDPKGKPII